MKLLSLIFLVCLGAGTGTVRGEVNEQNNASANLAVTSSDETPDAPKPPGASAESKSEPSPAEGVVPPAFPVSRYTSLWEHSPFQLESIAPPTESAGLAQKYALTGIAQVNGEPIVFLLDRATQIRHMLDKKVNAGGLSLVQVNMEKKSDDSTAVVRQGEEVGTVKFDAAASAGMMAVGIQGQSQPGRPFSPGQMPPQFPAQVPGVGVPTALPTIPGHPSSGVGARMPQGMPGQIPSPVPGAIVSTPTGVPGQVQPATPWQSPVPGQVQPTAPGQPPIPGRIIRRRAIIPALP